MTLTTNLRAGENSIRTSAWARHLRADMSIVQNMQVGHGTCYRQIWLVSLNAWKRNSATLLRRFLGHEVTASVFPEAMFLLFDTKARYTLHID
mmetsp:Transcript_20729/g.35341  ORF Transcript_20729/g.35341 Transcript_20729/m.35341 type:complete len:93 (+) Transcript_20729:348-626(+)